VPAKKGWLGSSLCGEPLGVPCYATASPSRYEPFVFLVRSPGRLRFLVRASAKNPGTKVIDCTKRYLAYSLTYHLLAVASGLVRNVNRIQAYNLPFCPFGRLLSWGGNLFLTLMLTRLARVAGGLRWFMGLYLFSSKGFVLLLTRL